MIPHSVEIDKIRQVLSSFNEGHSKRDLGALDEFMTLFAPGEEIEYIATGGVSPGRGTWRVGREAVRKLIMADWEYWGVIHIDKEKARININENTAWVSAPVTIITDDETEEFLGDKEEITGVVTSPPKGDTRTKLSRMTAVLVKNDDRWQFTQIHISFSIRSLPK